MNDGKDSNITFRASVISECLLIALESSPQEDIFAAFETVEMTKRFFCSAVKQYLARRMYLSICSPPYSWGDFHINDAGFQFKWKDHAKVFQLECLSWKDVRNRCKKLMNGKEILS